LFQFQQRARIILGHRAKYCPLWSVESHKSHI
jgi:hypothetical protein